MSLITKLSHKVGVEIGLKEEMTLPKSALNRLSIAAFRRHIDGEGQQEDPESKGQEEEDGDEEPSLASLVA